MEKIEFLDLKKINLYYFKEFHLAFEDLLNEGWFVLGKKVLDFELEYAKFSNVKYSVGVANGLDALILSLKALNIQEGDEIIVPSNTYIATWLAVSHLGAIPVPVEPKIQTYNLDVSKIEAAITIKTKAILVVNLYGQSAELEDIKKIAEKYKIFLLEDNAQAQGATCNNKLTGSFGIINATSFYPGKNLGALGDAGAITTNDKFVFERIKELRNYGSKVKYYNDIKGINSRLDEIQAAFLLIKLRNLHLENKFRNSLAEKYTELLSGIDNLVLPLLGEGCTSVYHIYLVRTKYRNELQEYLLSENIGTMVHYPVPPHLQKAYKELGYCKGDFPIAEEIADTCLSLPLGPHLSIEQVEYVSKKIISFFKKKSLNN
jgi:dTDP-4-amino-4,6-dideoxygalactose transaminase